MAVTTVDPIEMNYMEYLVNQMNASMSTVQLCRDYYDGEQVVFLTERMKEYLQLHNSKVTYRLNVCRTVIAALLDEMMMTGISAGDNEAVNQWAADVYNHNALDELQAVVHEAVLRDGESFVIVDWDADAGMPRLTHNELYVSTQNGGSGYGCWMIYSEDDPSKPHAAVKQWTETVMQTGRIQRTRQRRTVYYADRIERFYYDAGWKEYTEDGQPFPISLVDTRGKPLGLPVVHFRNPNDQSEIWDVIPQQDVINKLSLDVLAVSDTAGFPSLVTFGFEPLDKDGEPLKLSPMQMWGTTKDAGAVDIKKIEATDVTPLVNTLTTWIGITANISATPVSRFIMTGQIASSETLKEQDKPLQRKAQRRRTLWGGAWVHVMEIARRFSNVYGAAGLDEDVKMQAEWKMEYTSESLHDMMAAGVPQEVIWRKLGLSNDEIEAIKETTEYKINTKSKVWEAVAKSGAEPVPAEVVLADFGYSDEELSNFASAKMDAIRLEQEDVMPKGINL